MTHHDVEILGVEQTSGAVEHGVVDAGNGIDTGQRVLCRPRSRSGSDAGGRPWGRYPHRPVELDDVHPVAQRLDVGCQTRGVGGELVLCVSLSSLYRNA